MKLPLRFLVALLLSLAISASSFGSAYNGRPKLVVVVVIDQFRGDYLERYRDQFGEGGFRLFLDHGAVFTDCNYNYANTRTAPGHATLFTGAYTSGHGIVSNEWWDPKRLNADGKLEPGMVTSVWDSEHKLLGTHQKGGASPHNLQASTLGDELKLATQGKAHVYAISLKDRAAILPAGFAGDGAFWIDKDSGNWITSDYYGAKLPAWVEEFNGTKPTDKYWNLEWKDSSGNVLRSTAHRAGKDGKPEGFYDVVGSTPFANDYELEFARALVTQQKLGNGPATDLLVVSLSANDILGHQVGPDSPEMQAMALALDRQLAEFYSFLGRQVGLANVWLALSADHGVAPVPSVARQLRMPAAGLNSDRLQAQINTILSTRLTPGHKTEFVKDYDLTLAWLNEAAFRTIRMKEADAERAVGEAMLELGLRDFYTKSQLAEGAVPANEMGLRYLHSYSPLGGWYVMSLPAPYSIGSTAGTDHQSPYTYDTHVPLAFYGLMFQPGLYRNHSEPVDLAVTLASLLGINAPSHATGRVLTEMLVQPRRFEERSTPSTGVTGSPRPAASDSAVAVALTGSTR